MGMGPSRMFLLYYRSWTMLFHCTSISPCHPESPSVWPSIRGEEVLMCTRSLWSSGSPLIQQWFTDHLLHALGVGRNNNQIVSIYFL